MRSRREKPGDVAKDWQGTSEGEKQTLKFIPLGWQTYLR
jgi:hypothetical protein